MDSLFGTRRHFFHDCGIGLGSMALGSLLARDTQAAPATNPLAPKPPHFPAKAKAVIFLFMAGGPSQFELFEPKPELQKLHGQPIPESFVKGKRFAFMDTFAKNRPKLLGTQAQVRSPRQKRSVGLRMPAALHEDRRRVRVRSHGRDERLQPRAGQGVLQHRLAAIRPAEHGGVGDLRHRQRIDRPARLRRPAVRPTRSARRGRSLVERLSADELPGCAIPLWRRSDHRFVLTAWRDARAAKTGARRHPRSELRSPGCDRRSGNHDAHRFLRDGVSHADQCPGIDRSDEGRQEDDRSLRRQAGRGLVREQLPARSAAGRTRRALRATLSHRLGPSRRRGEQPGQGRSTRSASRSIGRCRHSSAISRSAACSIRRS